MLLMTQEMVSARLKTFDIPHKGLRNLLSQLNYLAGSVDFSNAEQVEQFHRIGSDLFRLLTEHGVDEDELVLTALEQRSPSAGGQNSSEHEMIGLQQSRLETLFHELLQQARQGAEVQTLAEKFYFELNHFHSAYLLHMLEEEEETQRLLWEHFSDAELMDIRRLIINRMSPESQLLWYRYSAPAMSPKARFQWLNAVKAAAPEAFFEKIMGVLREVLSEQAFQKLEEALPEKAAV